MKTQKMFGILACASASTVLIGATQARASAQYNFTPLGMPTGTAYSSANAINGSGDVVGTAWTSGRAEVSWEYSGGVMSVLPSTLSGETQSSATGINDSGEVVGSFYTTSTGNPATNPSYGYSDTGGTMTSIGTLDGQTPTFVTGVNGSGTVVGTSQTAGYGGYRAFSYSSTTKSYTTLGSLGVMGPGYGTRDQANAINAGGSAAGYSYNGNSTTSGTREAVVWNPSGTPTALGYLPGAPATGSFSNARGINTAGDVVGSSTPAGSGGGYHAFIWTPTGGMRDLGTLSGASYATGINDLNTIVGYYSISRTSRVAFVDIGGTMYNLNDLVSASGWNLTSASAINNLGDIVGTAYNTTTKVSEAFLLTPTGASPAGPSTPIPGSGLLTAVGGLALIGGLALRRRIAQQV